MSSNSIMFFNSKNSKKIIPATIALLIVYLISYLMLKGVGAPRSFFHTMMLVYLITLCSSSKKIFRYFVLPLTAIYALYTPIGFTYGSVSYDFLIAGLSTDRLEAGEFIRQIPYKNYLLPFVIIGGLILYRKITSKYDIHFFRNRTFIFIALIIMLAGQSPLHFINAFKESMTSVYNEQKILSSLVQEQSWEESFLENSLYDNYILIIGESARRDYHHAYGYPIENSPFMSHANGTLIKGLTGGGQTTVPSLKAMLTLSNKNSWDADYSKTIIGLAKSANIQTYWLSNQGYLGTHDTPISAIAKSSNSSTFLKYGSFSSLNTSDYELIPSFEEIIKQNPNEKKLIVIHLYGSHMDACDRISDYHLIHETNDDYYHYMSCYISSIHKTDSLLQILHAFLIKNHSSFSMIYISDHGHSHNEVNNKMHFNNSILSKFHYDIPLFMTSSDDISRKECQSFKSGLNFTNGIANWIGIKNRHLDPNYSLFDCQNDPDDFGLQKKIEGLEPDYPIDLRDK